MEKTDSSFAYKVQIVQRVRTIRTLCCPWPKGEGRQICKNKRIRKEQEKKKKKASGGAGSRCSGAIYDGKERSNGAKIRREENNRNARWYFFASGRGRRDRTSLQIAGLFAYFINFLFACLLLAFFFLCYYSRVSRSVAPSLLCSSENWVRAGLGHETRKEQRRVRMAQESTFRQEILLRHWPPFREFLSVLQWRFRPAIGGFARSENKSCRACLREVSFLLV